jgi:hypothetical protein
MNNFLLQIKDPRDLFGPEIQATIPYDLILSYYKSHYVRYQNFVSAEFVLEHPKRIYSRIRHLNEGGWCFTGRPPAW